MPSRTSCTCTLIHASGRRETLATTIVSEASRRATALRERATFDLMRFRKFLLLLLHDKLAAAGLVIIAAFIFISIAAPLLVGPYPTQFDRTKAMQPPSNAHPFGTDWQGFDVLKLVVYGGRVSILIGFISSIVAMLLGTSVGLVAGYYGRVTDQLLSRATDFFLVIPWLPFVLILVAILGSSLATIIFAIAIVSWPTTARIIRPRVRDARIWIGGSAKSGTQAAAVGRFHVSVRVRLAGAKATYEPRPSRRLCAWFRRTSS